MSVEIYNEVIIIGIDIEVICFWVKKANILNLSFVIIIPVIE